MKEFSYTITDPLGLHARPAGLFVKQAAACESTVSVTRGDKTVDAKRIFGVMGLTVKSGDTVTLRIEGPDEDAAAASLEAFMKETL